MKHVPWRRKNYRFPYYLLKKLPFVFKALTLLFVMAATITAVDSPGTTFNPQLTIDAYTVQKSISQDLYGYSTSSDFKYDANLLSAIRQTSARSMRLTDGFDPGARMLLRVKDGDFKILAADNVPYASGQEHILKAQVSGSNIKIYVDNQLIFNVNDTTFNTGEIGLLTSYNQEAYFDNIKVEDKNGSVLFSDSFDQKESSMWNNDNFPAWHDLGTWQAASGKYRHVGKQDISMKMAGLKNWTDYTLSASVKSQSSDPYDRGFVGLTFRHQEVLNSYRFIWRSDIRQPYSSNRPWGVEDFQGQINFVKNAGLSPVVTVNMRRDSPELAADLVYQLNTVLDLNIQYWELGNEIYAWGDGYLENKTYAQKIKDFSKAMKQKDSSIKVGATLLVGFSDWDIEVIRQAAPYIDFVIFHYYPYWVESGISDSHMLAEGYAFAKNYKTAFGQGAGVVEQTYNLLNTYAPSQARRVEFVVTEFNTGDYQKGVSLIYGLTVADLLGAMTEQNVKIGQFHKLAAETDWQWGAFTADYRAKPAALAISLLSDHFGTRSLPVTTQDVPTFYVSEKLNVPAQNVPYLSAYASKNDADSKLYLLAINKHGLADMKTKIKIENGKVAGEAKIYTLNGDSLYATNNQTNEVKITESSALVSEDFSYNFPAHSASVVEFDLKEVFPPPAPPTKEEAITGPNQTETKKKVTKKAGAKKSIILTGAGLGGNPHLKSFNKFGRVEDFNKFVFDKNFRGGVFAASGNLLGDEKKEIVVTQGKGGGLVKIYDQKGKFLSGFYPFSRFYRGGVGVAIGNLDSEKKSDELLVIGGAKSGLVKIYKFENKRKLISRFKSDISGAAAAGDVDIDGVSEIVIAGNEGSDPKVKIFNNKGKLKFQFLAFDKAYRGGLSVAAGDVLGDAKEEIIVGKRKDESLVKIYRFPQSSSTEFSAFPNDKIGVSVAAANIDRDKKKEIIVGAGSGGSPSVSAFDGQGRRLSLSFFAFDKAFLGGINVAGE